MISQLKSSAILLLFLGVLFSIPIVAKTWSAHGVVAALVTGLLVVVAVLIGPISFIVAGAIDTSFAAADSTVTNLEAMLLLIFGVLLVFAWIESAVRGSGSPVPYLSVTGWALMGVYFCVALVFTHTT